MFNFLALTLAELLEVSDIEISLFDIEEDDIDMVRNFCDIRSRNDSQYKTLKNSNSTRWNSVLSLLRSFIRNIGTPTIDEVTKTSDILYFRCRQQMFGN